MKKETAISYTNSNNCEKTSCKGCESCRVVNYEEIRPSRKEWKTGTQLYGAEAHHYYFYFLQLQNQIEAVKGI